MAAPITNGGDDMDLKAYQRDCLLGALSGLLMLVGDLCLSVVPYTAGDSGLFAREAYLTGGFQPWRLPLLLATGLAGMALAFFTVRASCRQIKPQYRKTRRAHPRRLRLLAGRRPALCDAAELQKPVLLRSCDAAAG